MTNRLCFFAALALTALGTNAHANVDVVTPFGIQIGSPGSCAAVDKKLRTLDPAIQRKPAGGDGNEVPGTSSYLPLDKVFPGATGNMFAMCEEDKLRLLVWSVAKGAGNTILLDVLSQLDSKYQKLSATNFETLFRNGGNITYHAGQSSVTVKVSGKNERFSLHYEFFGPITSEAIDTKRKRNEEALQRKGAL